MRLIDADALKDILIQRRSELTGVAGDLGGALSGVIKLIDNAPTIHHPNCDICEDKAKQYSLGFQDGYLTGKERRQGLWTRTGQSLVFPNKFRNLCCSICSYELDEHIRIEPNFCPNCGSQMKGGAE